MPASTAFHFIPARLEATPASQVWDYPTPGWRTALPRPMLDASHKSRQESPKSQFANFYDFVAVIWSVSRSKTVRVDQINRDRQRRKRIRSYCDLERRVLRCGRCRPPRRSRSWEARDPLQASVFRSSETLPFACVRQGRLRSQPSSADRTGRGVS